MIWYEKYTHIAQGGVGDGVAPEDTVNYIHHIWCSTQNHAAPCNALHNTLQGAAWFSQLR